MKILETPSKVGNFILKEQFPHKNYCRNQIEIRHSTPFGRRIKVGDVMWRDPALTTGNFWSPATTVNLAANIEVAILVESRLGSLVYYNHPVDVGYGSDPDELGQVARNWDVWDTTGSLSITAAALTRGDVILREDGLFFGNLPEGDAKIVRLKEQIEKQGIRIIKHQDGLFQQPLPFN